jgi:hypothetical protein
MVADATYTPRWIYSEVDPSFSIMGIGKLYNPVLKRPSA